MKYTLKDATQSAIGAFLGIVVFFAIRGNNPFFFNSNYGLIISALVIWIYWNGFNMRNDLIHFVFNLSIAFIICAVMSYIFGLITYEQMFTKDIFGSLVIVGWWVSIPLSLIFDQKNFTNPLRRYYVRGRG